MAATTVANICRTRADTTRFTIQIVSALGPPVVPIDITGFSFLLTVNSDEEPANTTNQLFQNIPTISDAANGIIEVALTPVQADPFTGDPGEAFYDVQMTDGGGIITTVLRGKWDVVQDITK